MPFFSLGRFNTYRVRLLLAIFAVNMVLVVILIVNRIAMTKSFIYERENNTINSLGQLLSVELAHLMLEHNPREVRDMLALADRQQNIDFVSVLDRNRLIRLSTIRRLENQPSPYYESPDMGGTLFIKSFPMTRHEIPFAFVQIGYSLSGVRNDIREEVAWAVGIGALMLLSSLVIAWVISGLLLKPLAEMKEISKKIAQGDFKVRAHAASRDIIGELAEALNNMAGQLGDLSDNMQNKIKEATRELEASNRKLMELDKLKSDFVSMVSHELRTPLTSIIGFSKTLATLDIPDPDRIKYLRIIETEGKRLAGLIEEYLDISKIEAGNFALRPGRVDFQEILHEILDALEAQTQKRVKLRFPPGFPVVIGDRDRLKRVFMNLIDNALKYSPEKEPIEIAGTSSGETIGIIVRDHGQGIRKEDLSQVFEKFYRGNDDITQKSRGSGLGLSIAKGIVEAHGGTISAVSEHGQGAEFDIRLPLKPAEEGGIHG